jgi:hypothetical protein
MEIVGELVQKDRIWRKEAISCKYGIFDNYVSNSLQKVLIFCP